MTLMAASHTATAPRYCPPQPSHPTPPALPHVVPTGEEALSLIKQAVAMK